MASAAEEPVVLTQEERVAQQKEQLRAIEATVQSRWEADGTFHATVDSDKPKFMVTFPYPYMNGRLHLGHAFSLTKAEFQASYQRMIGKQVLWPFAFHCTGMPIQAAANKLKAELLAPEAPPAVEEVVVAEPEPVVAEGAVMGAKHRGKRSKLVAKTGGKKSTKEILQMFGIADEEIPKFAEAGHWLRYFPPIGVEDLKTFGLTVDWRRSFITTSANPYYDSFIRWQFTLLKERGHIKLGPRPSIFSPMDDQVCGDHDRASGEGVGAQEYTLIKLKALSRTPSMAACVDLTDDLTIFLVAATLRPETMYGQTNCFVLPTGTYGCYRVSETEVFVCSARSALNMCYQSLSRVPKEVELMCEVSGAELIGMSLAAPLATYPEVYVLPLMTIKMNKGTGVVTSVPSDAPCDFCALRDMQRSEELRAEYGITEEMVAPFAVVPIIDVPGWGTTAAVKICDDRGIESQNEAKALDEAKLVVYKAGFYKGTMLVGKYAGRSVEYAKPLVREDLLASGDACIYFEPESVVMSRTGNECVISCEDQWYLTYGAPKWKEIIENHVASDNFTLYNAETERDFKNALGWLKEWGCARQFGLGTQIPFEESLVVESLSDSTIYMAYYTIAHQLQGEGNLFSDDVGPCGAAPSAFNNDVWSAIFLKKEYVETPTTVPAAIVAKLRAEFEYWYPMDLRVSGKDLIKNHLTMSLYNHAAIWNESPEMWPRAMFTNGFVKVDNEKMSKSLGNFMSLKEAVEAFSADATRLALASAGDSLEDANFERPLALKAIGNLSDELEWIAAHLAPSAALRTSEKTFADSVIINDISYSMEETKIAYEGMRYAVAVKEAFYGMRSIRNHYARICETSGIALHEDCVKTWISAFVAAIAPICPHFSEHCWSSAELLNAEGSIFNCATGGGWPTLAAVDPVLKQSSQYIQFNSAELRSKMQNALSPKKKGGKKKKGKKGKAAPAPAPAADAAAAAPPAPPTHAYVYVAAAWEQWKQDLLRYLEEQYITARDTEGEEFPPNMKDVLKGLKPWAKEKGHMKMMKKVRCVAWRVCETETSTAFCSPSLPPPNETLQNLRRGTARRRIASC